MQKSNKLIIILTISIFLFAMSSVYAEDVSNENMTQSSDIGIVDIEDTDNNEVILHSDSPTTDDDDKLQSDEVKSYVVNQRNFKMYFDDHNVLKKDYGGQIIVFNGNFIDKGTIIIGSPNTQITGRNTLFNNTVFCLESTNITLSNLNFVLDKTFPLNDNAAILVLNSNNTVYNCNIDYTVPTDGDGIGVYVECGSYEDVYGFRMINNTINIVGNNINDGAVYGAFLSHAPDAIVYGNIINASLPLKAVDWSREIYGGAHMDTVAGFAAEYCENLTFTNNHVTTHGNHRGNVFPTLDTVLIYDCHNSILENNHVYGDDYTTLEGQDNYLQGIDLYVSDNVTIIGNQIHMRTTGGSEIMGTAYPIQVTGPSKNVKIAFNNISSVNNGPNIGIYSQNFYGATEIQIISNIINITGVANKHYWALVAGIEVQDTNDLIWNNTIIVNHLGDYDENNNIYGISYSQNTNNNHSYNIQYNKVITNGRYAISLAGTTSLVVNSIIANNMLKTLTSGGDDSVRIGNGVNNQVYGNSNVTVPFGFNDLPDWLKNHRSINPFVPLIPISDNIFDDEDNIGYGSGENSGSSNEQGYGIGLNIANHKTGNNMYRNGTHQSDFTKGSDDGNAFKVGGELSISTAAGSSGDSEASVSESKVYEVTKVIEPEKDYLATIIISALAILLLLVGYSKRKHEEEY